MISQVQFRANLLRYLTGKLTEDESAQFEERLLSDQEFSDATALCEQNLIDAYALDSLEPEEKRGVQSWIEASTRRMQRVKMARALLLKKPQRTRLSWQIEAVLTTAAGLLLAVELTLFLTRPIRNTRTAVLPALGTHVVAPTNEAPSKSNVPINPQLILLVAERIRGEQQITTYHVRPDTPVQLQLLLPQEEAHNDYTLTISSLDEGRPVHFEQDHLNAQDAAGQLYLSATFAPGSFPPGNYRASVSRSGNALISQFAVKQ